MPCGIRSHSFFQLSTFGGVCSFLLSAEHPKAAFNNSFPAVQGHARFQGKLCCRSLLQVPQEHPVRDPGINICLEKVRHCIRQGSIAVKDESFWSLRACVHGASCASPDLYVMASCSSKLDACGDLMLHTLCDSESQIPRHRTAAKWPGDCAGCSPGFQYFQDTCTRMHCCDTSHPAAARW